MPVQVRHGEDRGTAGRERREWVRASARRRASRARDSALECVGTAESGRQAPHSRSSRPGDNVGAPHEVAVDGQDLFLSQAGLRGGPAPARGFLPDLIDRVLPGESTRAGPSTSPCPLDRVAEGCRAWTSAARSKPSWSSDRAAAGGYCPTGLR